ncbi:MAG: apolipoprotein N-acyltransferase, partial [Proteobacteria bacterium]|nr:apolipoprotein N-acyltransferase [Pseudomonadota bacterium]
MLLTLVSALLVLLSFPKAGLWPLAFVGLVPLFMALARTRSPWRAFGLGFFFGSLLVAGMGHWLFYAITVEYEKPLWTALLFVPLLVGLPYALLYGLFGAAFRALRRPGLLFAVLTVPALWTLMEYAKEAVGLLAPWGILGTAVVPFPLFLQTADLWGMYGLSFVLALVNGVLFQVLEKRRGGARLAVMKAEAALLALAVLGPVLYGAVALARYAPDGEELSAVAVQGNFSQRERWSGMSITNRVARYLSQSGCPEPGAGCVVVWPETVLNSPAAVNDRMFSSIMAALPENTLLIAGGLREDRKGNTWNSAYFASGDGTLAWYDKHILLPYGEKDGIFDFMGDFYTAPARFTAGVSPRAVDTFLGPVGAGICLEILYPDHVRRSV